MDLRTEIAQSWRRAELSGLSPASSVERLDFADVDSRSRLLRAASPVLDELARQLADTRFCVVLADDECRIVARRFSERSVETALETISAVPGCQFLEERTGTNSLATPFETRRGVSVDGDEHFLEAMKQFTCYGHPVVHPATRRLAGVLDITGPAGDANPLLGPFLRRAVADIERRLLDGAKLAEQQLLAAFQSVQHRSCAVLALGQDVVLANTAATELVDTADHRLLRELGRTRRGLRRLRLTSGTPVEVRVEAVSANAGLLFELAPVRTSSPVVSRPRASRGLFPEQVDERLRGAGRARRRVLISGEPGAGRTTAARIVAGDEPVHEFDASDVVTGSVAAWCARVEAACAGGGLLVVDGIQLLPPLAAVRLSRLLDTTTAWFALLSGPPAELRGEQATLAARMHRRIELPPLRERRDEIPAIARTLLRGFGDSLRLTPGALELLGSQRWPGNLRELAGVLAGAADRRSAGDLTAEDVAPGCAETAPGGALSGWEQAEYDVIVRTLRACDGNKVRAAKQLGISRSTLYNRMRALRVR
ncbi:Transcriptional regulator of acetoin/glycerol metabolism [Amycolatopsis pretoriensis]|uniref:Transcriptional regulator of acetoin/glycerol metabolism n=1 Tax=Amycolatopsis pretoriensis TaxID=218821 RepID=A0A1H5Q6W5_9PSEU|nr:helix-turn-helix domain-containing protein [Amycolatopsis pretoriensis]SEF21624.1 Transcriptional regulator of acetoin/glycerol metabolism [Amycolatopsis pretoriensis]